MKISLKNTRQNIKNKFNVLFLYVIFSLGFCVSSFGADVPVAAQQPVKGAGETQIRDLVNIPPQKFYNPNIRNHQSTDPFFNPAIAQGDYRKKYYQSCSVFIFVKTLFGVEITNLSTHKVSSCPNAEFARITSVSVVAQLKTFASVTLVRSIGPNIQLMDENNSSIDQDSVAIGNLYFSPYMHAEVGLKHLVKNWDIVKNIKQLWAWRKAETSYHPIQTRRNMDFVWYKGQTVYTLITDTGKVYVMSYFSPNDIENITSEETLTNRLLVHGTYLNLPPGWKYKSVVLKKVLRLYQIPFEGYIGESISDELQNLYVLSDLDASEI